MEEKNKVSKKIANEVLNNCEYCHLQLYYYEDGYLYPVECGMYCTVCGKKIDENVIKE